jgi:hypothetical protein
MAPALSCSSVAAAVKLEVRAAASKDRSQVRLGSPGMGRMVFTSPHTSKKIGQRYQITQLHADEDQFIVGIT